jgi:hypothetical protein
VVEHDLAKVGVAGSNPVSRSSKNLLSLLRRFILAAAILTPTFAAADGPWLLWAKDDYDAALEGRSATPSRSSRRLA